MVHTCNGTLLSHGKENECHLYRPRDSNIEWSKSDRERQKSHDNAYMWNLRKMAQMNLFES